MTICYVFYLFCLQNDIFPYVYNFHFVMFYMVFGNIIFIILNIILFLLYDMCMYKNVCFKGRLCVLWYSCPYMVLSLEFGVFLCVLWGVYCIVFVWYIVWYVVLFVWLVCYVCIYKQKSPTNLF